MSESHSGPFVDVNEAGRLLGVSASTVWRLLRRGALPSIRKGGRRLIPSDALGKPTEHLEGDKIPPLGHDHVIFQLVGAGRGGGNKPGARDKHAILDR